MSTSRQQASVPLYPDCSTCGHNASGVVAFRCTAFVPYPEGDPRGLAGYCPCRCGQDPAIRAWMAATDGGGGESEG